MLAGLMNVASTKIIAWMNAISVFWHVAGAITLIILIPAVAPVHQSGSYVFGTFNDWSLSNSGITNNGCAGSGSGLDRHRHTRMPACKHDHAFPPSLALHRSRDEL